MTSLNEGNKGLLYREQYYTINEQYQNMKKRPLTGEGMTYLMGIVGQPSIPGAGTLGQLDPTHARIDTVPFLPGTQGVDVTINIPRSNIADFHTRWRLIEDDTLPAFNTLVDNDPNRVQLILQEPFRSRTDDMRLSRRWARIIDDLSEKDWTW